MNRINRWLRSYPGWVEIGCWLFVLAAVAAFIVADLISPTT